MQLRLIDKKEEGQDIYSLRFAKPNNLFFYPGQYLDFKLEAVDPNGDTRAFTISSSPTEDLLQITVKKGLSPFKNWLLNLKKDEAVEVSHPAGTFILDESSPAILIAGGIGITPFRSMIKFANDQNLTTPITLIYSNSNRDFVFKEELEFWRSSLSHLKIIYHNSEEIGHINHKSLILNPKSIYYLAGSHDFVNNMAKMLIDNGIDETDIRYDRFDGY